MNIEHTHWYVVHAPDTPIQELVRKMKATIGDENVMFPIGKDRKLNRRTNEFMEKDGPLFFNYIFVKLGAYDTNSKRVEEYLKEKVNSHVSILTRTGEEKWSPLSDVEVDNIRKTMTEAKDDSLEVKKYDYDIGDKVRILHGPFRYFSGTVSDFNHKKRKVSIQVHIFGRENAVEIDGEGVEKIKE